MCSKGMSYFNSTHFLKPSMYGQDQEQNLARALNTLLEGLQMTAGPEGTGDRSSISNISKALGTTHLS